MANHTRSYQLGFHTLGVYCMVKSYMYSGITKHFTYNRKTTIRDSVTLLQANRDEEDPFADCDEEIEGLGILNPD